jgi:hypothetical protein
MDKEYVSPTTLVSKTSALMPCQSKCQYTAPKSLNEDQKKLEEKATITIGQISPPSQNTRDFIDLDRPTVNGELEIISSKGSFLLLFICSPYSIFLDPMNFMIRWKR